jgi:uncharacterized protein YndB with AHSA1/START domain
MADIVHKFPINAPAKKVFDAVSTPEGLDAWWTLRASGEPELGAEYELFFGDNYDWRAEVSRATPGSEFELTMTEADGDWSGTKVTFSLVEKERATEVSFSHTGWPEANEHYRVSCFCWAMYLRLLKRFVEFGEVVPYDRRLDV